ncbi:MAG TPA: hypothetical protein VNT99_00290, partial [Methylomirabilota bacterium]|nr:hypothetical protein [Methylomirabilota bacterium]
MKTVLTKCFGLWLLAAAVTAHAQFPPPPGGARPTNATPPTNSLFSRSANFGRFGTNNPATNAATRVIVPAPGSTAVPPGAAPTFPAALQAPPGTVPAFPTAPGTGVNPLLPAVPTTPSITATSANYSATN